ncbi:predicted protein [Sparassis crispa]|uniref:Uncharacterized protein n=1 Tax=Sparassis crispa TaxID=139825 RepID=A0A401H470_9APHY|nr:predicted protein [Sparassis crispa]GBE89228.1 predicted protein [Sparassis crispa]
MLTRSAGRKTRSSTKGVNTGGGDKEVSRSVSSRSKPAGSRKTKKALDDDARPAKKPRILEKTIQEPVAEVANSGRPSGLTESDFRQREVTHPVAGSSRDQDDAIRKKIEEYELRQRSLKCERDEFQAEVAELRKSEDSLNKREEDVTKKEEALARTEAKLNERDAAVVKREQEAEELIGSVIGSPAEQVLAQLEESFTCTLCFDVMLVDKLLTDLIDVLHKSGPAVGTSAHAKRNQKAAEAGDPTAAWREGGSARAEWKERERKGRDEMRLLTANWSKLRPLDFRAIRDRTSS